MSQLLKDSASKDRMDTTTRSFFIAEVFKVLDYDSLLRDSLDVDTDIIQFYKQALTNKQTTSCEVAAISYSIASIFSQSNSESVPASLFQNLLSLALQSLQTGSMASKSDRRSLHWSGKLVSALIKDKHPLASSSKIAIIDSQELSLSSLKQGSVLFGAFLDIQKAKAFRNSATSIRSIEDIERIISFFKHPSTTLEDKVSATQLLALLLLQGSLTKIVEATAGAAATPSQMILNLLNHEMRTSAAEEAGELQDSEESLKFNIENERVLALLQQQNRGLTQLDLISSLKSCCSLALKVELCRKESTEAQFRHVMENLKTMLQFKYTNEYQHFQENPTSAHSSLKQPFHQDLHEQTVFEYSNFFFTLL